MVFRKIRILPLLIIVAFMAMSMRIGEIVQHRHILGDAVAETSGRSQNNRAENNGDSLRMNLAQLEAGAGNNGGNPDQDVVGKQNDKNGPKQDNRNVGKKGSRSSSSPIGDVNMNNAKEQKWPDASQAAINMSDKRKKLYKDLAKRRKELDKRAEKLKRKKALLQAAEKEIDKKHKELKNLRDEIKALLKKQSAQKEERISSLVKIYSGMKADDAARIFNTLEMDVLVAVMSRMSERNLAPILAEMDSEKARQVTMLLAEEKDLPSMPEKLNN